MADDFDPYESWLGIPPAEQPASFYRLLGLAPFEADMEKIVRAADERMSLVRNLPPDRRGRHSQQIFNELSAARICLTNAATKESYDAMLRQQLEDWAPAAASPPAASPPAASPVAASPVAASPAAASPVAFLPPFVAPPGISPIPPPFDAPVAAQALKFPNFVPPPGLPASPPFHPPFGPPVVPPVGPPATTSSGASSIAAAMAPAPLFPTTAGAPRNAATSPMSAPPVVVETGETVARPRKKKVVAKSKTTRVEQRPPLISRSVAIVLSAAFLGILFVGALVIYVASRNREGGEEDDERPVATSRAKAKSKKKGTATAVRTGAAASPDIVIAQEGDGSLNFAASLAQIDGAAAEIQIREAEYYLGGWTVESDRFSWKFRVTRGERFRVVLSYSAAADAEGGRFAVQIDDEDPVEGPIHATRSEDHFVTETLFVNVPQPGEHTLKLLCVSKPGEEAMLVKSLQLKLSGLQQLGESAVPAPSP